MEKFFQELFLGFWSLVIAVILGAATIGAISGVLTTLNSEPSPHQEKQIMYYSVWVGFATQYVFLKRYCENKVDNFLFSAITLAVAIWYLIQF